MCEDTAYIPHVIYIDGIDGSGKTTFCKNLVERLKSENIPVLSFTPFTASSIGVSVRKTLVEQVDNSIGSETTGYQMLSAVSAMFDKIRPELRYKENVVDYSMNKPVIVVDRTYITTAVYNPAVRAEAIRAMNQWVARVDFEGYHQISLLCDTSVDICYDRLQKKIQDGQADALDYQSKRELTSLRKLFLCCRAWQTSVNVSSYSGYLKIGADNEKLADFYLFMLVQLIKGQRVCL